MVSNASTIDCNRVPYCISMLDSRLMVVLRLSASDPKQKYTNDRYHKSGVLRQSPQEPTLHGRWAVTHCTTVHDGILFTIIEGV